MWSQLEPTAPHLTYLILSSFLISYALFGNFIRNKLHLSSPPLAVVVGILLGPHVLDVITPRIWGLEDNIMQEITRVILGIQCFAVGIELPKFYFNRHWKSVAFMLGPVMAFGWVVSTFLAWAIFKCTLPTAMIIGACLTPTDPVLAASVLAESKFSDRVPKRIRHLLSAESACNDGVSFPFLYAGLVIYTQSGTFDSIKEWFLITVLWQCVLGLIVGLIIGRIANRTLRFSDAHDYAGRSSFVVFYLLIALLSVGVGSVFGFDDFLVAFGAGVGFAHDGWFSAKRSDTEFPSIVDFILNSTMFVYFGADIPWKNFSPRDITPHLGIWQLFLFLVLVLLLRRIPIVLACKRIILDIKTYREALFCGHFGPMGIGALFLAMEARAQLETGTSLPLPEPPQYHEPYSEKAKAVELIWPVICFVVLGSIIVHGGSVAIITVSSHLQKDDDERAPLIGAEDADLEGMQQEGGGGESEPSVSGGSDDE